MLPPQLLQSLIDVEGFDKEAFEEVHASSQQLTSIRINPVKNFEPQTSNFKLSPVPWSQYG
ncbi:MAG: methyltransferase RsmF C-terminal domain-like protein, partial [Chitinophagaceae bacterium]